MTPQVLTKKSFSPESSPPGSVPNLEQISGEQWTPLYHHNCTFSPTIFREVMLNLIRNPNINSNHLFRADISLECSYSDLPTTKENEIVPRLTHFIGFDLKTVVIRTMIPRNVLVDRPLDQTCLLYEQVKESGEVLSLVVYLPHISAASESPFYHPAVHGIGFLHTYHPSTEEGAVSIHYSFFPSEPRSEKLERTAMHLLQVLYKHGQGTLAGYVKRVQHDVVIPQSTVQNTYARLKSKYARTLSQGWVETTDPSKHVFEDLAIAAFLIQLWAEMYKDQEFPGFVDIGCGNGLLVHLLLEEGYTGWGFDARKRKSWPTYSENAQANLKEMVLIPSIIRGQDVGSGNTEETEATSSAEDLEGPISKEFVQLDTDISTQGIGIHDGTFPPGTFIISNHADELTPWTPLLATLSQCPFMMIPCCSHGLNGGRFRAPPPKEPGASKSGYASLVAWVAKLAEECGWQVEKEMLRIPSTRNTALIGRHRNRPYDDIDVGQLVETNGGAFGWEENAMKLVKSTARSH